MLPKLMHPFALYPGIVEYSADLIYEWESGALNEAYADIFGVLVQFWAKQPAYVVSRGATMHSHTLD